MDDRVTPLIRRMLGDDLDRAHPRLCEQYSFTSDDRKAFIGEGVMEEVWRGRFYTVPFLHIGATRRVMFPDTGRDVPVTIANYAYVDRFGRETLTWTRNYLFDRPRRFDETLIFSESRDRLVLHAGTHQHLAVDMEVWVEDGALRFRSGRQRLYEGFVGIHFPMLFSGIADVTERYNDELDRFEVDVRVENRIWGPIFGYRGWFKGAIVPCDAIPDDVRPVREERRE